MGDAGYAFIRTGDADAYGLAVRDAVYEAIKEG